MTQTKPAEFVLWGFNGASSTPIKITGGSLMDCTIAQVRRKKEGWTVGIYRDGAAPDALRRQAEAAVAG